ncbi:hypothetical protein AVEN_134208-1 [Araneus ventricosus]|uniref:Uncharacterized protein n=1 Tax=Araneus ventricosus TaxID=182803 RepID=A0A4Y2EQK8_ARAVE|nr:hypothetical protein AVEN_134208-1 [Araneus ventricosus]
MLHHCLAVLLNTRGTDVFNLELDKQKKHSFRGVPLSCPGKDYLLAIGEQTWIRTQELPSVYPERNIGIKVSGRRNVLNIITCNLSSNDGHRLWGARTI